MSRALAALLVLAAAAPALAQRVQPAASPSPADPAAGYRIGPEDVLQIVVWQNEALTRTVPVRPDGKVSLPLLNDVQAADLTPQQLRDNLARKLGEFIANPEISVIVTDVRSFKVSVLGEVEKPGRYDLKSRATVMDVLAMAGGFKQYAARSRVVVLRSNGRGSERIPFDFDKIRSGDGGASNFEVRPNDIVVVP